MKHKGLLLEKQNGMAVLTLDRPQQLNALTMPMLNSLPELLAEAARSLSE